MIELKQHALHFRFDAVHPQARCSVNFQRTLRIPDDNRSYPLPAGLGRFPLFHVDDFATTVPPLWNEHGGVFMPMYQSEAMWISFGGDYPCAIKVAAGKINAVTGKPWSNALSGDPQDYAVIPEQPWLDGFCVKKGTIRQFVAMPLGAGYTAEEQITGKAEHGGLQIIVYPMKAARWEKLLAERERERIGLHEMKMKLEATFSSEPRAQVEEMGLAPGGLMRQEIYEDKYGLDAWDTTAASRCFVHLVNSEDFVRVTGHRPPTKPISAKEYGDYGMPWFDYYANDAKALEGAPVLAGLDSVAARQVKQGQLPDVPVIDIDEDKVRKLGPKGLVREGRF